MNRSRARNAADKHFKTGDPSASPPSTFEAVTAAARATRAKSLLLQKGRLEKEEALAAVNLPSTTARSGQ